MQRLIPKLFFVQRAFFIIKMDEAKALAKCGKKEDRLWIKDVPIQVFTAMLWWKSFACRVRLVNTLSGIPTEQKLATFLDVVPIIFFFLFRSFFPLLLKDFATVFDAFGGFSFYLRVRHGDQRKRCNNDLVNLLYTTFTFKPINRYKNIRICCSYVSFLN